MCGWNGYVRVLGKDVVGHEEAVCDEVEALVLQVFGEERHVAASSHVVDVAEKMSLGSERRGAATAATGCGATRRGFWSRNAAGGGSNTGHGCG